MGMDREKNAYSKCDANVKIIEYLNKSQINNK